MKNKGINARRIKANSPNLGHTVGHKFSSKTSCSQLQKYSSHIIFIEYLQCFRC